MCVLLQENIGIVLMDQGKLAEAMELYQEVLRVRVATLGPEHPDVGNTYYNITCAHSLAGSISDALANFESAVSAGYSNRQHADSDTDLDNIRGHEQFQRILARI
jgi:tetratricopeptide (TPR) repeat protein